MSEKSSKNLEESQNIEELNIYNQISQVFLTFSDEEMYNEVLKIILKVFKSEYGVFGYVDEQGALIIPSMTRHIWDKCQVPDKNIIFPKESWGDSLWPQAMRQRKILYSNEKSTRIPSGHIMISRNLCGPIVFKDASIGLLQVANKSINYDDNDLKMMDKIVNFIAPVLNARLERDRLEKKRLLAEDCIRLQAKEILENSTPVIKVLEGIIITPIIGTLDSSRTQQIMEKILNSIVKTQSSIAILDITGVPTVDTSTASNLIEMFTAIKLLGAQVIVTGISPTIAQTIVHLGVSLSNFLTYSSLENGLKTAIEIIGMKIGPKN